MRKLFLLAIVLRSVPSYGQQTNIVVNQATISGKTTLQNSTIIIDPNANTDLGITINNADTQLGSNPGTIIVPDGNYAISTPITLSSNRTLLLGAGTYSVHLNNAATITSGTNSNISIIGKGWSTITKSLIRIAAALTSRLSHTPLPSQPHLKHMGISCSLTSRLVASASLFPAAPVVLIKRLASETLKG